MGKLSGDWSTGGSGAQVGNDRIIALACELDAKSSAYRYTTISKRLPNGEHTVAIEKTPIRNGNSGLTLRELEDNLRWLNSQGAEQSSMRMMGLSKGWLIENPDGTVRWS